MPHEPVDVAAAPPGDSPEIPTLRATPWFYGSMVFTQFAVYASLGAAIAVLLPATATAVAGENDKVGALGLITAIGALGALLAQPIIGRLSDRTRWGPGRRATWVSVSGLVAAAALAGMSQAPNVVTLAVVMLFAQIGLNGVVAMINTALPDRVPVDHRARVSGALGISLAVGAAAGIAIAGFVPDRQVAWIGLAVLVLIATQVFAYTNSDVKAPTIVHQPAKDGSRRSLFASLPRSSDYWWAFGSKFAVFMTYQAITSYLFFILSDHIQLATNYPDLNLPQIVSLLSLVSLVALTVVSAIGGILADKVGRLKPFVMWAAVGFATPGIILIVWPTLPGIIVAQVISGASFGLYSVVDQALLSRVIPAESNAARDLGVLNIAGAVPNVAAPAIAGLLISTLGGYSALFIFASACAVLGGLAIRPIKKVR